MAKTTASAAEKAAVAAMPVRQIGRIACTIPTRVLPLDDFICFMLIHLRCWCAATK
jgi:hypothetical protein